MAGLVMSNVGQAISGFGANIGNLMFKSIGDEADRDARIAARKEEWMARLQDRQDARTENNDLKRELLEMKLDAGGGKSGSSSGGKGGGINMEDIKPGGSQEVWAAGKLKMTVPEYTEFYNSMKTGDRSALLKNFTTEVPAVPGMGAYQGQTSEQVSAQKTVEAPPGFEAEYRAKMQKLADLHESYALGGHYDDVMKGRQQGFQTGVGEGVLAGNIKPGAGSEAVGASLAKERMKVEGGEKLNVFTGDSSTTPLGKSQINENNAQAVKAKDTGGTKPPRVQSTKEDSNGNMVLIMSDGTSKPLLEADGKPMQSAAFNKEVARTIAKMEEESSTFKKLSETEKRQRAQERLTGKMSEAAPAAKTDAAPKVGDAEEKAPSIAEVKGAPPGASIGVKTAKGWEMKDKSGKLLGYVRGNK
jgi:hypothetical protein